MKDDTKALMLFTGGLVTAFISKFFYGVYKAYKECEYDARTKDIDDVRSLYARERNNPDLKHPLYPGKMVYVTGVALAANGFDPKADIYSKITVDIPSCLITSNPLNAAVATVMKKPKMLFLTDQIRYKSRSSKAFSTIDFKKGSPFMLVDSHKEAIKVIPNSDTELYATRVQRTNDYQLFRKTLELINFFSADDKGYV
jgi:hypothetical protein